MDAPSTIYESHMVSKDPDPRCNCLIDSATTHVILRDPEFFLTMSSSKQHPIKLNTLGGPAIGEAIGRAQIRLTNGTILNVTDAIYSPSSCRNLLSFKALREAGYHVTTANSKNDEEILQIKNNDQVIETAIGLTNGLYAITIDPVRIVTHHIKTDDVYTHF